MTMMMILMMMMMMIMMMMMVMMMMMMMISGMTRKQVWCGIHPLLFCHQRSHFVLFSIIYPGNHMENIFNKLPSLKDASKLTQYSGS